MINEEKSVALIKHFGFYGYGNFDVYVDEIAKILTILDGGNVSEQLKEFYEKLERQRMG